MSTRGIQDGLFSVEGKTAIVTGGGRGMGAAYVRGLAERGANVVIADIDGAAARAMATSLESTGASVAAIATDTSDPSQVDRLVGECVDRYGAIDVLINNAGVSRKVGVLDTPVEEWDRLFSVNVRGTFLCTQRAGRIMSERRQGSIINVSSTVADYIAIPMISAYTATKGAVGAWTRASALELARYNVRVNAIAPGFVVTPMASSWQSTPELASYWDAMVSRIPLGRTATPEDMLGTILFLASDASSYVTGATIIVDGGYIVQ